jgi:hypothetical protein
MITNDPKYYGRKQDIVGPPKGYNIEEELRLDCEGINNGAIGKWTPKGFLILEGSFIRKSNNCITNKSIRPILNELIKEKRLKESHNKDYYQLVEYILTSSPSSSACLILGSDRNGYVSWRIKGGQYLEIYKN